MCFYDWAYAMQRKEQKKNPVSASCDSSHNAGANSFNHGRSLDGPARVAHFWHARVWELRMWLCEAINCTQYFSLILVVRQLLMCDITCVSEYCGE